MGKTMEKPSEVREINYLQYQKLRGIMFWRREQHIAKRGGDIASVNMADKAIRYLMEECDKLGIPYSLQNNVLNYFDVHTDVLEILRDLKVRVKHS